MFAGLLIIAAALAGDPTGARPGAGTPELVWAPVVQLRTGGTATGEVDDLAATWTTRGRLGLEVERKVLTARLTVSARVEADGAVSATILPGEAWVRGALPLSSAIGLDATAGLQPLDFDGGTILGDDDERLTAAFPAAGRLHLRAAPWDFDLLSAITVDDDARHAHALRLAAGRNNPVWAWHVSALGLLVSSGRTENPTDRPTFLTTGVHADADLNRVRLRGDGYLQPTSGGPAWLAGGEVGYAVGDDARVELGARVDSLSGGDNPVFLRPFADTHARFGWVGLFDDQDRASGGGNLAGHGALDAAFVTTAIIAPQLRFSGAAHHLWDGSGHPLGPELDADLKWYWSPLAALHLRGGAYVPWSNPEAVRIDTAATIDVSL